MLGEDTQRGKDQAGRSTSIASMPAMPELPEVETVARGLARLLEGAVVARIEPLRADLRRPIPAALSTATGAVRAVRRRAKYLLIDLPGGTILCHLGMTGSWRLAPAGDERSHDHCLVHLADGRRLAYRDPRRFGLLDWIPAGAAHPALAGLGPEPLDEAAFTADYLSIACRGRRSAIKGLIMDQAQVVGVGNIYAQEALFRAGIRPGRAAGRVPRARLEALVAEIRAVLTAAIAAGGSTISDFRQAGGEHGWFQQQHQVYGRGGQPCAGCGHRLASGVVAGRGTTWCPRCQR
jgi:formamidopyrimidine-DNA glycosylase